MRILHAVSSIDPAEGGVVASVLDRGRTLIGLGHTVEIVSADAPDAPWVRDCPIPVHAVGPGVGKFKRAPAMPKWIQENAHRFDAMIADGVWQHNLPSLHQGAKGTGVPYFVFTHGMLDPWFKQTYPLKHLKKVPYWLMVAHPAMRDARSVLFTCEEERLLARESFTPYNVREAITTLGVDGPTDLDAAREAFLGKFPEFREKRYLLFLGRLNPKKGCDMLLKAFAKVAPEDVQLVMAGPDSDGWKAELESIAQTAGISNRVTWAGMLTGDVKWGAYACADAFVLPSHQENFGVVVAESLACRCPVLLTKKVNIWREVVDGGGGLATDDDEPGIAALLSQWFELPEEARAQMKEKGRQTFETKFEATNAAKAFIATLTELCGKADKP